MLFMVVERFKEPGALAVYRRARDRGRLLPEGLHYVASWVDVDWSRCFQLMETEDASLFEAWTSQWCDLVDFEITPVRTSADAGTVIALQL